MRTVPIGKVDIRRISKGKVVYSLAVVVSQVLQIRPARREHMIVLRQCFLNPAGIVNRIPRIVREEVQGEYPRLDDFYQFCGADWRQTCRKQSRWSVANTCGQDFLAELAKPQGPPCKSPQQHSWPKWPCIGGT